MFLTKNQFKTKIKKSIIIDRDEEIIDIFKNIETENVEFNIDFIKFEILDSEVVFYDSTYKLRLKLQIINLHKVPITLHNIFAKIIFSGELGKFNQTYSLPISDIKNINDIEFEIDKEKIKNLHNSSSQTNKFDEEWIVIEPLTFEVAPKIEFKGKTFVLDGVFKNGNNNKGHFIYSKQFYTILKYNKNKTTII